MRQRFFKYTRTAMTRGEYGVGVIGGHNTADDPKAISVFDPDFGDEVWIEINAGITSGDWIEITKEEHGAL